MVLLKFILNMIVIMLRKKQGVYVPFERNCATIIVLVIITILVSFKQLRLQSDIINKVARHMVSVYLIEKAMRILIVFLV